MRFRRNGPIIFSIIGSMHDSPKGKRDRSRDDLKVQLETLFRSEIDLLLNIQEKT